MVHSNLLIIHTNDMAVYIQNVIAEKLFNGCLGIQQSKSQKMYKDLWIL